jgi:hypothetical protein
VTADERESTDFVARVLDVLDAEPLPDQVIERLATARRRALAEAAAGQAARLPAPGRWLPVGALAATLLAAVLLGRGAPPAPAPPLEDDVQLAAVENLELLENLDFAAWMVETDVPDAS